MDHLLFEAGLADKYLKKLQEKEALLAEVKEFLDELYIDQHLSHLFRSSLVKIRCKLCDIDACSTRNDRYECLIVVPKQTEESK